MQHTMSAITAVVLAAFVGYAGAWYTGAVEGNFALLLLLATVVVLLSANRIIERKYGAVFNQAGG